MAAKLISMNPRRVLYHFFFVAYFFTASALADEHPLLMWQLDGTNNTIYLLGSVHLLREQHGAVRQEFDSLGHQCRL